LPRETGAGTEGRGELMTAAEGIYHAMLAALQDGDPAVADALDKLALETGRNGLRHAASVFRGNVQLGHKAF
jgi:hypothetical protein